MAKKAKPYPRSVMDLLAEKSALLSKAHALADMGMPETALPLWASAAAYEDRLAPLLEALGRDREAAVHRLSAASCYQRAGELSRAVNLYHAALAGPTAGGYAATGAGDARGLPGPTDPLGHRFRSTRTRQGADRGLTS
jgi:hypothetical protein